MQPTRSAAQRATEYLRRIAALTGAEQIPGEGYCVRVGHRVFVVHDGYVHVISHRVKSTCFSTAKNLALPPAEVIASALLHLKNNPKLVKKWRKRPGCAFKPNGKMFWKPDE
jgi:hypothetical protein